MVAFIENFPINLSGRTTVVCLGNSSSASLLNQRPERSSSFSSITSWFIPQSSFVRPPHCWSSWSIQLHRRQHAISCSSSLIEAANNCLHFYRCRSFNQVFSATVQLSKKKSRVQASGADTQSQTNGCVNGSTRRTRTAVVWFKHDLRTDDHPGLVAAGTYPNVIPLFVLDPVLLAGWSTELIEALRDAVLDLRQSLQTIGSDLVIRSGRTADVLLAIAREFGALDIITEEEIDMEWNDLVGLVSASLSVETIAGQDTVLKQWRNSLYEFESFEELPECYKIFQGLKYPVVCPLDSPTLLPTPPKSIDRGFLPSLEEILHAAATVRRENKNWDDLKGTQKVPAEVLLEIKSSAMSKSSSLAMAQKPHAGAFRELFEWREKYLLASPYEAMEKKQRENMPKVEVHKQDKYVIRGGATGALNSLKGYLRFQEPTGRDDWQEVHQHVMDLEHRPGASFRALFGNCLTLGTLSLRRIHFEAMEYERARGGGWLSPFGFSSFTGGAAIKDTKAIEWYQLLAFKSREQGRGKGFHVGTWRWRGFLVQYAVAGEAGPPVVFVHGFGAFWDHFRDNIKGVAEAGNRVWALTMLGFGRSEKPMIVYTDLLWGELVRDFIVEVVREPVALAGNSIGGYTVSVVGGLWPALVKSLILFNSAGRVIPEYRSLEYRKPKEKSQVAYVGSRLLLAYLQNLSNGMLTKCYPTNPWRADNWLQAEVMRASYDPNATAVLEAMFHLRAPLPLNYYLDRYNGKILVVQGMRDPLHNSSERASMLQAYCKNVSIQYVNAGHCPHDEVPEEVNSLVISWLKDSLSTPPEAGNGTTNSMEESDNHKTVKQQTKAQALDPITRIIEEVEELV